MKDMEMEVKMTDDRFIWVDLETTGLDPRKEFILEIGFIITDIHFEEIDSKDFLIWETPQYDEHEIDDFVHKMHTKSELLKETQAHGRPVAEVQTELVSWLRSHGVDSKAEPLCGSSVSFDRSFLQVHMLEVASYFHYRNIDISTVKELCKRLNPELYSKLEKYTSKRELHRVVPDLEDTISEAKFYTDNFFHC